MPSGMLTLKLTNEATSRSSSKKEEKDSKESTRDEARKEKGFKQKKKKSTKKGVKHGKNAKNKLKGTTEVAPLEVAPPSGLQIFTATPMRIAVTSANFISFILIIISLVRCFKKKDKEHTVEIKPIFTLNPFSLSGNTLTSLKKFQNHHSNFQPEFDFTPNNPHHHQESSFNQFPPHFSESSINRPEPSRISWNFLGVCYVALSYSFAGLTYYLDRYLIAGLASFWTGFVVLIALFVADSLEPAVEYESEDD